MKKLLLLTVASLFIATNIFCQTATFEDFELTPESHYIGSESLDGFSSGDFYFENSFYYIGQYAIWAGFGVANYTETNFDPSHSNQEVVQCYNVVGSGYDGSSNYAVVFCPDYLGYSVAKVNMPDQGAQQVTGTYVTNSAYAYYSLINGDNNIGDPFGAGDWFKIVATGENIDGETTTTEFYLADFRSNNADEHFIVEEWTWFDLSVLGEVVSISFKLDASRKNSLGVLVPLYFCLDNFNGDGGIGVNNYVNQFDFTTYPNPTTDYINIKFDTNSNIANATIKLYDINGRLLQECSVNSSVVQINMMNYNSGVYFVEVNVDGNSVTKQVVRQ